MRNNSFAHRNNMCLSLFRTVLLAGATAIGAAMALWAGSAAAATIVTFDVRGNADTIPTAINNQGEITGYTTDGSSIFVREPDGSDTEIIFKHNRLGNANGINDKGQITGKEFINDDRSGKSIGDDCFLLLPHKDYHKHVLCTPSGQTAEGSAINVHGTVVGTCSDTLSHGFIFDGAGSVVFDAPGAVATFAFSINASGSVTGYWMDADSVTHGYVRDAGGTVTEFDVPGSSATFGSSINDSGTVAGFYDLGGQHSFVRDSGGGITLFDPPGASFSFANGINKRGVVVGDWGDQFGVQHGYVRLANGTIKSIDVPGAVTLSAEAINSSGEITGFFTDDTGNTHGFLRTP